MIIFLFQPALIYVLFVTISFFVFLLLYTLFVILAQLFCLLPERIFVVFFCYIGSVVLFAGWNNICSLSPLLVSSSFYVCSSKMVNCIAFKLTKKETRVVPSIQFHFFGSWNQRIYTLLDLVVYSSFFFALYKYLIFLLSSSCLLHVSNCSRQCYDGTY